jgi:cytochrome c-type biogenesis protein CcmH
MSRRWLILLVAALLVGGVPAFGQAALQPRASLPDIEDEVMCPTCGVPLINAFSPQAEKERRFIRREIARGKTKAEIKDALVSEFGRTVLAVPRGHGFDLTAYVVPVAAIALAATALAGGIVRRRRRGSAAATPDADLSSAETTRLERELSRYDL